MGKLLLLANSNRDYDRYGARLSVIKPSQPDVEGTKSGIMSLPLHDTDSQELFNWSIDDKFLDIEMLASLIQWEQPGATRMTAVTYYGVFIQLVILLEGIYLSRATSKF